MKKILTNNIQAEQQMPFSGETMDHLQESYSEILAAIGQVMGAPATGVMILTGCKETKTDVGGTLSYDVSAGWIIHDGEILQFNGATGLQPTGTDVLVWNVQETYRAGDPVTYVNSSDLPVGNFNTHSIRTALLAVGASGSGIGDYNNHNRAFKAQRLYRGSSFTGLYGSYNPMTGAATISGTAYPVTGGQVMAGADMDKYSWLKPKTTIVVVQLGNSVSAAAMYRVTISSTGIVYKNLDGSDASGSGFHINATYNTMSVD